MTDMSPNWNIEVIPGARRVRRAAEIARGLVRFLPDTPLASHGDHFHAPIADRDAGPMLDTFLDEPTPGQVGGVIAEPTLLYPIIDDRQPRLEFPTDDEVA